MQTSKQGKEKEGERGNRGTRIKEARIWRRKNGNGKWDAGDPFTLEPAEQIINLKEEILVKANWEVIDKNFDMTVDKDVNDGEEDSDL